MINSLLLKKREKIPRQEEIDLQSTKEIEEEKGKLQKQDEEDKLMHSVLENDNDTIDDGKLLNESFNQGVSSFTPDMMFENIVQNFSQAEKLYGPKLLRLLTGYDPSYLRKNVRIPEFCRQLQSDIDSNIKNMKRKGLLNNDGTITSEGVFLASLILYTEELDHLVPKGFLGKKEQKKKSLYGDHIDVRSYKQHDRFRDIHLKRTINTSIKRGHKKIHRNDLKIKQRKAKGSIEIIYALDASGSMRGKKIETAKKAGVALGFKATQNRDKVGLIVFGTEIKDAVHPTVDFQALLSQITQIKASTETNLRDSIQKAIAMFSKTNATKHLILLTDAVPSVGQDPEKETLQQISQASALGITTSVIGIDLDESGETFAEKMAQTGQGRLYLVKNLDKLDTIVLEEYYQSK